MPAAARSWEPANDVERTLRHAWDHQDTGLYLRTLAYAPLYLPGFPTDAAGGQGQRLLTRQRGDRAYLLVFTSPQALVAAIGELTEGWRLTSLAELSRQWPDGLWGLAVSPTTPIGSYLNPDELAAMAELVADEPVFHPVDAAEALMFQALRTSDPGAYLDVLVISQVTLPLAAPAAPSDLGRPGFPWRVESVDGTPTIAVFTSPARLPVSEPVPTVVVEFIALAAAWPDPSYQLAVNPDSAIASSFTGGQLPDLLNWAGGLLARQSQRDAPARTLEPDAPLAVATRTLELVLDASQVDRYLHEGYHLVSGVVCDAVDGPATALGYLVRWHEEPDAAGDVPVGENVHDLPAPSGTRLYQVRGGTENLLATYHAELRRWVPAVTNLLRGL